MSQGLTWIAGRRTPLVALAVLLALVASMFIAFAPAGAKHNDDKLGNVTHNTAQCNMGDLQGQASGAAADAAYGTQVNIWVEDRGDPITGEGTTPLVPANDPNSAPDEVPLTSDLCEAEDSSGAGDPIPAVNNGAYFSITPNGTESPIITKLNPTAAITLSDSDGVVADDTNLTVTISLKTIEPAATGAVTIEWVRVSGELDGAPPMPATLTLENVKTPTGASATATIAIPDGTSEREYTVSARITYDHDGDGTGADATALKALTPKASFTVGDPGTNAASAELSLGNAHEEDPLTSANDVIAEDGTEAASDGDVWLVLSVSNSLGEKANGSAINTVTVIAPGATLSVHTSTAADALEDGTAGVGSLSGGTNSISVSDDAAADTADVVGQTMFVKVARAGSPPAPGTVTVYALVIGTDGAPRSQDVDVIFTGSAAVVVLGDDVSVGKPAEGTQAQAEISLGAQDTGGNNSTLGTVVYSVKDADDKPVSQTKVKAQTSTAGSSTEKPTDDSSAAVVLVTVDDTADPGVYTIEASLNGVDDSADTATVTVTGATANIELTIDDLAPDTVGQGLMLTATVTDDDGNTVADGTEITITSSDVKGDADSVLVLVLQGADNNVGVAKTKNGVATARLVVVGSGAAVVTATNGAGFGVVVINSTAGADAAVEAAVEPADGLSQTELNNFASWSGEGSVSASELLAGIADASGVLFYDGDSWQRYGVVDGQVIPGSRDFTIRSGQTIWISG